MSAPTLTFTEHLEDLRRGLIKSLVAVGIASAGVSFYSNAIMAFFAKPVGKLVFIDPTEAFVAYLKVVIWGGVFIASPYVIYQVWTFVAAGLQEEERKNCLLFAPASFVLFVVGVLFNYFVVIRYGLRFLLTFGAGVLEPMITVSRYISFIGAMSLAFGLVFQLPLVIFFLSRLGLITPAFLREKRRYAVVLIFIAAGILTPSPDIFSQMAMAVPLLVLYEAGIILAKIAVHQRERFFTPAAKALEDPVKGLS